MTDLQKSIDTAIKFQLPMARSLKDPHRSRCLFCLAYEYLNLDMEEKAFPLLEEADPEYFKEQLGKDMKTIPNMEEIVTRSLSKLIDMGFVKIEQNHENK